MTKKTKKRIAWAALIVVILLVVADICGSLYLVNFALKPEKVTEEEGLESLYKRTPDMKPWVDSVKAAGCWCDTFVTINGTKERALYIKAPKPTNKVAVIVHGYKTNSMWSIRKGRMFNRDLGYNILLPDLYAHGKSDGDNIRMGWLDRLDVMKWMDIANNIFRGDSASTQMVVLGVSMGAATTMCISGEKQQPYVRCFIEDCGYTSVHDEFVHELKVMFGLPSFPLLNTASMICKAKYGWDFEEASPLEQVKKCKLPMLFIHGDNDDFVPSWMVHPLYEAKNGPKQLYIAKGSAHAASYDDHPAEYTQVVRNFLGKYIK